MANSTLGKINLILLRPRKRWLLEWVEGEGVILDLKMVSRLRVE